MLIVPSFVPVLPALLLLSYLVYDRAHMRMPPPTNSASLSTVVPCCSAVCGGRFGYKTHMLPLPVLT
jgi:hypothetical protein